MPFASAMLVCLSGVFSNIPVVFQTLFVKLLARPPDIFFHYFPNIVAVSDLDSSAWVLWLMKWLCQLVLLHKLAVIIFVMLYFVGWFRDIHKLHKLLQCCQFAWHTQKFWINMFSNVKFILPVMQKMFHMLSDNYPKDTSNHRSRVMCRILPSGACDQDGWYKQNLQETR